MAYTLFFVCGGLCRRLWCVRVSVSTVCLPSFRLVFFFFFQAEDGIRDRDVTGVQTCALPIYRPPGGYPLSGSSLSSAGYFWRARRDRTRRCRSSENVGLRALHAAKVSPATDLRDRKSVV